MDDYFLGAKKSTSNLGFKQHPDLEDVGILYTYLVGGFNPFENIFVKMRIIFPK